VRIVSASKSAAKLGRTTTWLEMESATITTLTSKLFHYHLITNTLREGHLAFLNSPDAARARHIFDVAF
jgi:hypothetical protein